MLFQWRWALIFEQGKMAKQEEKDPGQMWDIFFG